MEEKTATVLSSAVETWLTGLEREGWAIHGYTTTSQAGGKVRVTATVARTGRPGPAAGPAPAAQAAPRPAGEPVGGGLW